MTASVTKDVPLIGQSAFRQRMLRLGTIRGGTLALADGLGLTAGFTVAALLVLLFSRHQAGGSLAELFGNDGQSRAPQLLGLALPLLAWLYHKGHYGLRLPFWTETGHVLAGCLAAMLADGFLQYALKVPFSRLWLFHTWVLAVPAMLLARRAARAALQAVGMWDIPVMVVASPERLEEVVALIRDEASLGYRVAVAVTPDWLQRSWSGSWLSLLQAAEAQAVILSADDIQLSPCASLVSLLALEGLPVISMHSLVGLPVISTEAHHLVGRDVLLLSRQSPLARPLGRAAKMATDYVGGLLLLTAALPLFLVAMLVIRRDGGPVFYAHTRIGRHGRSFRCLKFRTMVKDAEAALAAILDESPNARVEWEATHKLRDDPRVTPFGRFLRTYSLDEVPQLINVLRGEMSLVGPRPVAPNEVVRFTDQAPFYLQVKPGMTGLWQVSGRNELDYVRRTELNTWYVKNWSLWLDTVILVRTLPVVLSRTGAY